MKSRLCGCILSTIIIVFVAPACVQSAPIPAQYSLSVARIPQPGGDSQFYLSVGGPFDSNTHLPDGSKLQVLGFPFVDRVFNSFAEFHNAIVGDWNIHFSASPTLGLPDELYKFTIADFPESAVSSVPPIITSPIDGGVVPATFGMNWEWPANATPTTSTATLVQQIGPGNRRGSSGQRNSDFATSTMVSAAGGSLEIPSQVILRVGSIESSLAPYISTITPEQASPQYSFTLLSSFSSYSLPVTVSVAVPEPTTAALLLLGILGCGYRRNR
jgi:hypothetical protein